MKQGENGPDIGAVNMPLQVLYNNIEYNLCSWTNTENSLMMQLRKEPRFWQVENYRTGLKVTYIQ